MFGTPSLIEIIIILVVLVWIVNKISGKKVPWISMLIATLSLVALMFGITVLAWRSDSPHPEIQIAVAKSSPELSEVSNEQLESETAKQTAIRTRIEILEKELLAGLEQGRDISETGQKSKKPKPSPGEAVIAENDKKLSSKQREEKKQLLEKAKQELKQEKEKSNSQPRWMYSITLLDKKTLEAYLANQNDFPNRFVISSGRFMTIDEAQSDAERLAKIAIKSKIIRQVGQSQIKIDDKQLRPLISRRYNEQLQVKILDGKSTNMHRQHLLIDMSPENMMALFPSMRETVVEKRIYTAAGGLLGIMLMSGLLSLVLSRGKE